MNHRTIAGSQGPRVVIPSLVMSAADSLPDDPKILKELGGAKVALRTRRISAFVFLTFGEAGETIIQSAAGTCRVKVFDPDFAALVIHMARGVTLGNISSQTKKGGSCAAFLALLLAAGLVVPLDAEQLAAPTNEKYWEFHDLLFHRRSRLGRTSDEIGGTYPWAGKVEPEPAIKKPCGSLRTIPLSRPDLQWLKYADMTLTAAIENRRSIRIHGAIPISLTELGVFLYRTARVRDFHTFQNVEFTSRPYPSGGASYELELYVCVDRCVNLERGVYYYDPAHHQLHMKRRADFDFEQALNEAWLSSAKTCRPQVLIIIASRFKRVAWKYRGMAYATQLKNCGILYGTMYLVAESMNLAACGLGLGNPSRFARMTECDFYTEGSIGEFMLGTRGWCG